MSSFPIAAFTVGDSLNSNCKVCKKCDHIEPYGEFFSIFEKGLILKAEKNLGQDSQHPELQFVFDYFFSLSLLFLSLALSLKIDLGDNP